MCVWRALSFFRLMEYECMMKAHPFRYRDGLLSFALLPHSTHTHFHSEMRDPIDSSPYVNGVETNACVCLSGLSELHRQPFLPPTRLGALALALGFRPPYRFTVQAKSTLRRGYLRYMYIGRSYGKERGASGIHEAENPLFVWLGPGA